VTDDRGSGPAKGEVHMAEEYERGAGWIFFAGIMVFIAAVLNCIWGIAAIDKANFFVADAKFIISDLSTWGWIILGIGLVQMIAAFSIWAGGEFGRWIGIFGAGAGLIGALLSIPGYPFYSLAVFGIDLLVLYGLAAYGGRQGPLGHDRGPASPVA
jgi:hypothetical protein